MQVPYFDQQEALNHEVFNALMWALSYPGKHQLTHDANLQAIGHTLLDLETSFFTPDQDLKRNLKLTTAREKSLDQADYLFFPQLESDTILSLQSARRGNLLYPDQAATLVVACEFSGRELELRGPGIEHVQTLSCNVPLSFWQLRQQVCRYPLGWDMFLCDGNSIVGLPRSLEVRL